MKFSAQVNLYSNGKIRGFATLGMHFDEETTAYVDNFRIIEGRNGLFVGFPSGKPYEKGGEIFYPDTFRIREPKNESGYGGRLRDAITNAILQEYESTVNGDQRQEAANAQTTVPSPGGQRPSMERAPSDW